MNLAWSVLVLALVGTDDPQPSKPQSPILPPAIAIGGPEAPCQGCKKAATPAASAKTSLSCPKTSILDSVLRVQLPVLTKPKTTNDPVAAETWPMTLQQATRIGLDNSEIIRVVSFSAQDIPIGGFEPAPLKKDTPRLGQPDGLPGASKSNNPSIVIARINTNASNCRFKAEVMAHVRSVEQQYWNLAQAHVQLWSADRAVSMAQEVLDREQAELLVGRGTVADVAEAAQRLEQLGLDLVTRTSDVITTERQLRNILGLPAADNRRIIPVTPANEHLVTFDWDSCVREMMRQQPDVVQQKLQVRVAELQLLIARNAERARLNVNPLSPLDASGAELDTVDEIMMTAFQKVIEPIIGQERPLIDLDLHPENDENCKDTGDGTICPMPSGVSVPTDSDTLPAQAVLLRSRAYLQQVVHQTTHSLARFFLEIDANYKQYMKAGRLKVAATQRLDAQRAYYEEGRITIDRFLDAVSQYATAVATEAQFLATYNISLAALAEAKGTLLADRGIVVANGPLPANAKSPLTAHAKTDDQTKQASFEPAKSDATISKPKTWNFSFSIGWDKPLQVKGTISVDEPAGAR
jgi:hypothetical protein